MVKIIRTAMIFLFFFFSSSNLWANLNMPFGVTPVSQAIYRLHMLSFIICCIIGLIVFALISYSLIYFRKSKHEKPAAFHENTVLEIIWTTIPFLILISLAIPATQILRKIHDTNESALTIKVTGHQWKWEYEYLDSGIRYFSFLSTPIDQITGNEPKNEWYLLEVDKPMVVPINTKVKLLITSGDVIHSWWVPELGVKQDAIPGFINENWINVSTPGYYRGQCGELCGVNHAFMPIVVKAVSQEDYNQWLAQEKLKMLIPAIPKILNQNELMKLGKLEYDRNCAMCHQTSGEGLAYSYPALKRSRVVTAPLTETITYVMRGVPSAAMQAFGEILDDASLAAVITYIRNSWGNDSIIQQENFALTASPQDIAAVRQDLHLSQGVK
jgi:cytochrome c oxidase subunit II